MVEAAKDFGVKAEFRLPSMTSASLGSVFTSVATSITSTQTEMTDVETLKQKKVRSYRRESRKKANEEIHRVSPDDFFIYHARSQVTRKICREWFDEEKRLRYAFETTTLQSPKAEYVAMAKASFGEGAERCAFRFFEVASDQRTIVGKPLVAKESRLILAEDGVGDEQARKQFVRTFCKTQQLARRLASEFNEKMAQTRRIHPDTPRVTFLDCSIYELMDKNLGKLSVLVEEKLDHTKWHKWNSNNGYVEGMKHAPVDKFDCPTPDLGAIEEGSEDEDDTSDDELFTPAPMIRPIVFSASEVAQAFSHFTYQTTGRKRLVCDLQGVFDENANVLRFSDPVIHYHNPERADRRCVHGQTDRGEKGVRLFFDSHNDGHHGHLCKLVLRGFRRAPHRRVNPQDRRGGGFSSQMVPGQMRQTTTTTTTSKR